MKNIKYLILFLSVAIFTVSCETYDDYDSDRVPVIGFTKKNQNINNISAGTPKSVELEVFISEVAANDRTFNIITIPIDNTVEYPPVLDPANYEFDATVTIPANERSAMITVTGINVSLTDERTYFRLAVEPSDEIASGGRVTVGLTGR